MRHLTFILLIFTTLTSVGQETKKDIKQADKRLVDMMFFGLDYGIENKKISG
jgi:hypothetical protein